MGQNILLNNLEALFFSMILLQFDYWTKYVIICKAQDASECWHCWLYQGCEHGILYPSDKKENAFCLFFTSTPFPLVKWMKLTPRLYCLRPTKVNGTARTEADKCPCDALQGNPVTKAACKEGWVQQKGRLWCTQWTALRAVAPTGEHHCPLPASQLYYDIGTMP